LQAPPWIDIGKTCKYVAIVANQSGKIPAMYTTKAQLNKKPGVLPNCPRRKHRAIKNNISFHATVHDGSNTAGYHLRIPDG
jgi:hypothetical protein